ncbi:MULTISPECIES: 50S ribosomal protein L13 [Metallosphaera]|uniref:Large ribosomal subunit protein uL13 n=3 Tax=Metallosphaera TaxID=41980 RepID=A4YIN0_METS5|nr:MULTISPECIES: 50S ribosomal protein L13 [Metallosphaera]ABP96282.1 LSU ribosomal protein L13P [Metallosphaera sedula DSM 5348]AIM28265.1 LSU ribosomal protein L13P [Metallosphaera sedula]AKV75071.1 50S ribosomal protein L13 [Metallosphaera sedula]AKV77310.1 50S ribosomal protein L13 [Metallosphaera sedula]AKV79560.1 50S ribosomal protein L13 [Metallosphaera sedula]
MTETVIVDGEGQILGRLASKVVGLLKEGKRVVIVNGEKIVISGPRNRVVNGYMLLFSVGTLFNPYKLGVRRPRTPINIVKRTIRGMLPKTHRGETMLKMVKVYVGIPKELQGKEMMKFEDANVARLKGKYITVGELSKILGWKGNVN